MGMVNSGEAGETRLGRYMASLASNEYMYLRKRFEIRPLIQHLAHGRNTKTRTRQSLARHYIQYPLSRF